ncbi:MAG: valine--tRNA ligase [bacterium]|nr:valine--tRNA ligase [bacterium]
MKELPPNYNPKETEDIIYKTWEQSGYFNPDKLPPPTAEQAGNRKKTFTVTVPPPNVTGSLHMGHALNATIQDILIRKKRMEGYKTLWIPGTDHAGIATQNVVEKDLKKQGLSRHDLGREKFLEKVWEWKQKYGDIILNQFKKLGASMDWSRTRFTMDEEYQKAVATAFSEYHKKGLLYKAEKVINWCTRCQTSLSDLELEYKEEQSTLWEIKYPLKNTREHITVSTTRPETMLGDSAVAVNPQDKRYKKLVGAEVLLPIQNRVIPIITDDEIDMTFGTGAVKVTPAHDLLDARIGEKNKLPIHKVIDVLGRMTQEAGPLCAGLKVKECREKIIEELKKQNLIVKETPYAHNVALCYRCNGVVEPLPSLQWFVKMEKLAKIALDAVKKGNVTFHPKNLEKIYIDWLRNIRDWNISRQIWWGHKIPLEGENDVLDTWFSSALWPFATLGWPNATSDFKTFYPTQVLSTARDIINLWVARMIYSGLFFTKKKPFTDVIIHGTILTKDGKRMSKSLGTGIDPMVLIEQYGADATRFGLIWQAMGGQDIHWDETAVMAGKKFANKFWNISRYILGKVGDTKPVKPKKSATEDTAILKKLAATKKSVSKDIDTYEFGKAIHTLYDFLWHDVADVYLESTKQRDATHVAFTLSTILTESLTMLHPFMPHLTETIYQNLPHKDTDLLIIKKW